MSTGRIVNIAAAVLVGGASNRMGEDKARRHFRGVAAATRASRLLASLFDDVLLVGGDPPDDAVGRRVADVAGPRCALRGVVSALEAARAERVLVVATDLLLLGPELLLALVAWPVADVVMPRHAGGRIDPLCALWHRERTLELARVRLAAEQVPMHELVSALDARFIESADLAAIDPSGTSLSNANTAEAWARLE